MNNLKTAQQGLQLKQIQGRPIKTSKPDSEQAKLALYVICVRACLRLLRAHYFKIISSERLLQFKI